VSRVELSEAERERALARFTFLRPHLEEGLSIQQIAADAGVSVRTVQRWVHSYREIGLAGLTRKPRADHGQRKLPDDLVRLIEGLALRRPPPTAAAVCRQAVNFEKN